MHSLTHIVPLTLIIASIFTILAFISGFFHKRPYTAFFIILVVVAACISLLDFLPRYARASLAEENQVRLNSWRIAGCIAPEEVARNIFIAKPNRRSYGTAFAVKQSGSRYVASNNHVTGGTPVTLTTKNRYTYTATPLTPDNSDGVDLALHAFPKGFTGEGLPLIDPMTKTRPGEHLLIVGHNSKAPIDFETNMPTRFYPSVVEVQREKWFPWSDASFLLSYSQKIQSMTPNPRRLNSTTQRTEIIRIHGDTASGNSGSPVVNCQGQVVGVYVSGLSTLWYAEEQSGWFIPSSELESLIRSVEG